MTPAIDAPPRGRVPAGGELAFHRPATLQRTYPATSQAPDAACESVEFLAQVLEPQVLAVLLLLVRELVTNAVEHGKPSESLQVTLRLLILPKTIAALVEDDGPGFAGPPRVPHEDAVQGWGLHLVGELADRFGVRTTPRTSVWFELERRPSRGGSSRANGAKRS